MLMMSVILFLLCSFIGSVLAISGRSLVFPSVFCRGKLSGISYRDPQDCNYYYQCGEFYSTRQRCSSGKFFSDDNQECTYPEYVPECQDQFSRITQENINQNIESLVDSEEVVLAQSDESAAFGSEEIQTFSVSLNKKKNTTVSKGLSFMKSHQSNVEDIFVDIKHSTRLQDDSFCIGKRPTFYPDPNDCEFFYQCGLVLNRRHHCAAGKVFNPLKYKCDLPSNVPSCNDNIEKGDTSLTTAGKQLEMKGQIRNIESSDNARSGNGNRPIIKTDNKVTSEMPIVEGMEQSSKIRTLGKHTQDLKISDGQSGKEHVEKSSDQLQTGEVNNADANAQKQQLESLKSKLLSDERISNETKTQLTKIFAGKGNRSGRVNGIQLVSTKPLLQNNINDSQNGAQNHKAEKRIHSKENDLVSSKQTEQINRNSDTLDDANMKNTSDDALRQKIANLKALLSLIRKLNGTGKQLKMTIKRQDKNGKTLNTVVFPLKIDDGKVTFSKGNVSSKPKHRRKYTKQRPTPRRFVDRQSAYRRRMRSRVFRSKAW